MLAARLRPVGAWLRRPPARVWIVVGACLAIPLFFTVYTGQVWEDFFITYRYSENLARGLGLVYSPGEHVHGFTSPLNTLLPALFAWVTRARDYVVPLWLFRFVSLGGLGLALAAATTLLVRAAAPSRAAGFLALAFPLIAVLEIKTTAFTMNGQETGLVFAFLIPAFALAVTGWPAHARLGGFLWAGLLYARPDACVYVGAMAVAAVAFETGSRQALLRSLAVSGLICAALYLPWLLFTWTYFGSPVPHTIVAKYGIETFRDPVYGAAAPLMIGLIKAPLAICWVFSPIYDWLDAGPGCWPAWMHACAIFLELAAALYWLLPTRDRLGRMASLVACLLLAYQIYVLLVTQFSPWYYPPLAFLSLLALVSAAVSLVRRLGAGWAAYGGAALAAGGLGAFLFFIFSSSLFPLRFDQQVIEWGNRRAIGLWLKDHVRPGEAVYLEPLGYIGYFSQCKMLDWPGLVSPEVVAARRKLNPSTGYNWLPVAEALRPAWIVARAADAQSLQHSATLGPQYELAHVFDVTKQVDPVAGRPGMRMVYPEVVYGVFHRKAVGTGP